MTGGGTVLRLVRRRRGSEPAEEPVYDVETTTVLASPPTPTPTELQRLQAGGLVTAETPEDASHARSRLATAVRTGI